MCCYCWRVWVWLTVVLFPRRCLLGTSGIHYFEVYRPDLHITSRRALFPDCLRTSHHLRAQTGKKETTVYFHGFFHLATNTTSRVMNIIPNIVKVKSIFIPPGIRHLQMFETSSIYPTRVIPRNGDLLEGQRRCSLHLPGSE